MPLHIEDILTFLRSSFQVTLDDPAKVYRFPSMPPSCAGHIHLQRFVDVFNTALGKVVHCFDADVRKFLGEDADLHSRLDEATEAGNEALCQQLQQELNARLIPPTQPEPVLSYNQAQDNYLHWAFALTHQDPVLNEMARLWTMMDADGDDVITVNDFDTEQLHIFTGIVDLMDKDHDGRVTAHEFRSWATHVALIEGQFGACPEEPGVKHLQHITNELNHRLLGVLHNFETDWNEAKNGGEAPELDAEALKRAASTASELTRTGSLEKPVPMETDETKKCFSGTAVVKGANVQNSDPEADPDL